MEQCMVCGAERPWHDMVQCAFPDPAEAHVLLRFATVSRYMCITHGPEIAQARKEVDFLVYRCHPCPPDAEEMAATVLSWLTAHQA